MATKENFSIRLEPEYDDYLKDFMLRHNLNNRTETIRMMIRVIRDWEKAQWE